MSKTKIEAMPVESEPVESEPVESEPVESEPVESESKAKPKVRREPLRAKPRKGDAWITATIFDHPSIGGKIWRAQMLYSAWMASVAGAACIFRPDIPRMKKLGAFLGMAIVGAIALGAGYQFGGVFFGAVGAIVGTPVGALLGWIAGPLVLGNKPIIMAARVPAPDGQRQLIPIEHNYCRTVSSEDYSNNLNAILKRINASDGDDDDDAAYDVSVFRGTRFYADLAATDVAEAFVAGGGVMEKVQIGAMFAMAAGSVILLFFVAVALGG
jgi:hypothetical protein